MRKRKREKDWHRLPDNLNINRFVALLPSSVASIKTVKLDNTNFIFIRMSGLPIAYTIAEKTEGNFLSGLDGFAPMGSRSLKWFLQMYWRYLFEDILKKAGYSLEQIGVSGGGLLMVYHNIEEQI